MKKVLNGLGILGSLIILFALIILEIALGLNLSLKKFLKTDKISEIIEKVEFERLFTDDDDKVVELDKDVYNIIDEKTAIKLFKNKELKKMYSDYLASSFISKIDEKTSVIYPTSKQLADFATNNYELVKDLSLFEDVDQKTIGKYIEENYDNIKVELEKSTDDVETFDFDTKYFDYVIGDKTTYIILGLILFCIILLIIFRMSLYKWFLWFYISTMTVSLQYLVIGLFTNTFITYIMGASAKDYKAFLSPFIKGFTNLLLIYGIVLFFVGIISFIVHKTSKPKEILLQDNH